MADQEIGTIRAAKPSEVNKRSRDSMRQSIQLAAEELERRLGNPVELAKVRTTTLLNIVRVLGDFTLGRAPPVPLRRLEELAAQRAFAMLPPDAIPGADLSSVIFATQVLEAEENGEHPPLPPLPEGSELAEILRKANGKPASGLGNGTGD